MIRGVGDMTIKSFKKSSSSTPDLNTLSQSVYDFSEQLVRKEILDGIWLRGVVITTVAMVPHSLGRRWNGFIITNKDTFADIIANHNTMDTQTITLVANTPVTVDLWVF